MTDSPDSISTFLKKSPSVREILNFIEGQAQQIAAERRKKPQLARPTK